MIVISDPKCAEYILKTNFSNYVKGPIFYHRFVELFGDGIFNADGSLWKSQRQVASHLFKVSNLKDMMKVFIEHTHKFSSILQSFADSKQVIDVQDYFSRLTMDSIGKIAFGCELDSLSKTNVPFANAFDQSQVAVAERFLNPFWNISFFRRFMYTEKEFQHSLKVMNEFAYDIIQQRRKDPNLASKTDLLSQYLQMSNSKKKLFLKNRINIKIYLANEDGKPFSDQYLRDILLNYMIAGRDTTAITTTFVIYLLAQNPHVEKKLLEEIASKIGMDHEPDYDILKDMPYLTAVIDETLRLYPPVSYDPKHSLNDDVLPNGMKVPKGSQVAWTAYGMGRSSLFFPDPLKFKPERFLDPAENGGRKIEPGDLIPFQAGPRICLGKPMAYLEVKTVVIMLLQRWKFQCANDKPVILVPSVTLYAKGGILMNVEKRN